MTSLLETLRRTNTLRTLDYAFAQSLRRLDADTPDTVLAAAALASLAVANGHAGFDPADPARLVDADIAWPTPAAWHADLAASRWVTQPPSADAESAADTPLVLEHGLLYLRRYREYERRLAVGLRRIGSSVPEPTDFAALASLFARLFLAPAAPHPNPSPAIGEGLTAAAVDAPSLDNGVRVASTDGALFETVGSSETDSAFEADALFGAGAPFGVGTSHVESAHPEAAVAFEAVAPSRKTSASKTTTSPASGRGRAESTGEGALPRDLQPRAAATALRHNLVLITGGPGTGKTTTITRLLALLVAQARQAGARIPRIALAAPTGRAAERMAESVRKAVQHLADAGVDATLLQALPVAGTTLHRLLGTIPDAPTFRHHVDNPLPFDVVVVDEASMIDLPLMAKLVEAVADGARLVLLGDPDQLPSVEAGDVLSGILRAAGDGTTLAPDDAVALAPLLDAVTAAPDAATPDITPPVLHRPSRGFQQRSRSSGNPATLTHDQASSTGPRVRGDDHRDRLPPREHSSDTGTSTFPGRHIHLQRGYRQAATLDLAPLATAVRDGDTSAALRLLRAGELAGIHFHDNASDPLRTHRDRLFAHWTALADTTDPVDALALAGRLRLLTAVRDGPQGARGLNARIEAMLSGNATGGVPRRGADAMSNRYFHGRLLLITENSYRHRLFNGDIGICLRSRSDQVDADDAGAVMAWFPGDDPRIPRAFHPAALPAHDSAFAMTVHKAQGSEFDTVWLILPDRPNRVLSRELVYTGMTRARRELHVAARADVIADALARHAGRWSGLGWRLRE